MLQFHPFIIVGIVLNSFPLTLSFVSFRQRHRFRASFPIYSQQQQQPVHATPWYSDPEIKRDRIHLLGGVGSQPSRATQQQNANISLYDDDSNKFVLMSGNGMVLHLGESQEDDLVVVPFYLSASEMNDFLENECKTTLDQAMSDSGKDGSILVAWVGKHSETEYWVVVVDPKQHHADYDTRIQSFYSKNNTAARTKMKPLREFGDRLASKMDSGILATANGLVEFHKSHWFCSYCGSKTLPQKAGACRRCVGCQKSVYPRLDVATIMLILSPCGEYALLGRKPKWPNGRYSTLAGFAEVGETLEECCIRETWEESFVEVDPSTMEFVASQPWPFPRSLMVGFQARAIAPVDGSALPDIQIDRNEMEDIQWFAKDYVKERLSGGSTALDYVPSNKTEEEFHIPGKASLARLLITHWAQSD